MKSPLLITDFHTGEEIAFNVLFSKTEVCRALSVSVKTLERQVNVGKFPKPNTYVNGLARWTDTTINNWLNKNNQPRSTPPNFASKEE